MVEQKGLLPENKVTGKNEQICLILVEFESDRMGPRESAKNGRIGAYGLKCRIFLDSELIFEIYDKNNPREKIYVLTMILKFLPLNH